MKNNFAKLLFIFLFGYVTFLLPDVNADPNNLDEGVWTLGPFIKHDAPYVCLARNTQSSFDCPHWPEDIKWEEKYVFNPAAIVKDKKIYLLYRAEDSKGSHKGTSRIGIAESTDGSLFTRYPSPVLHPDPNDNYFEYEWDGGCEDPRIVEFDDPNLVKKLDGRYCMTYTAFQHSIGDDPNKARLFVATSDDLFNWKKHGPVFDETFKGPQGGGNSKAGSIVCKRIGDKIIATKVQGKYWMYWGDTNIYLAYSDDLINWTPVKDKDGKYSPVLKPRKDHFDNDIVEPGPPALLTQNGILLIYNSKYNSKKGNLRLPNGAYAAGQALFDPNDPKEILSRTKDYFLGPNIYENKSKGQVPYVRFLEGLVHFKDRWFLYFGVNDSKVAVTTYTPNMEILNLAKKQFGSLNFCEEKLFIQVGNGKTARFNNKEPDIIQARYIKWLCTNSKVSQLVTNKGIMIENASIHGKLDLSFAMIKFPLSFDNCTFSDGINLEQSKLISLHLPRTHATSIEAKGLEVKGDVRLVKGFKVDNHVYMVGARIGGVLDCSGGIFGNKPTEEGDPISDPNKVVLEATGINVGGNVKFTNDFKSYGVVSLYGAQIGRELDCKGGTFYNPGWVAFNGDQMEVQGCVFQGRKEYPQKPDERSEFKATGQVRLIGANIGNDLNCSNGKFITHAKTTNLDKEEEWIAFKANNITVNGNFLLNEGFVSVGMIELKNATIDGYLSCTNSMFINSDCVNTEKKVIQEYIDKTSGAKDPNNIAIEATGIKVDGNVSFGKGFKSYGVVSLYGAQIGRELDCKGGDFNNPRFVAFNGEQMEVIGSVYLAGKERSDDSDEYFKAEGQVRLIGTTIGGNLNCYNGEFINPSGEYDEAIDATRVKVSGDVLLGNDLKVEFGPTFAVSGDLKFNNAEIGGVFYWQHLDSPQNANKLDMQFTKIGTLDIQPQGTLSKNDDQSENKKWPRKVLLNGLVYDEIKINLLKNNEHLKWINWPPSKDENIFSQPYEQLAKVLKRDGKADKAKDVLIEKNKRIRKSIWWKIWKPKWLWYCVFGPMIGYGYKPWDALFTGFFGCRIFFSIPFWIALGSALFALGKHLHLVIPSEGWAYNDCGDINEKYPRFNCFIYSLDLFLPVIDLRQSKYWQPNIILVLDKKTANKLSLKNFFIKFQNNTKLWFTTPGGLLCIYTWIHILTGWVLTTLLIAGLTGLIRT